MGTKEGKILTSGLYLEVSLIFQAVLAGDYILGISSVLLARIGNSDVISLLSRVIQDLVRGIFLSI
jgi:geranylgeranyl pyrophosphate synthase